MAKKKNTIQTAKGLAGLSTGLQANAKKAQRKNVAKQKADAKIAEAASKAEQKRVDKARKERDAKKKR